jgi:hypothetical protein
VDVDEALAVMWQAVAGSSQAIIADQIEVSPSTLTLWKSGTIQRIVPDRARSCHCQTLGLPHHPHRPRLLWRQQRRDARTKLAQRFRAIGLVVIIGTVIQ